MSGAKDSLLSIPGGPGESAPSIPYQPGLDGLRAVAVIAVLLYHGGSSWMRGGYLGVDVFFVLSGFLITTLLLREWSTTGGIALLAFWARRARRLLPALALLLVGVAAYAAIFARPEQFPSIRGDAFATLGYVTNWRFVISGQSYFDRFTAPSPLRHMWSLAIEEQFYLVWPLLILALLRLRVSRLVMCRAFAVAAVASAMLMAALYEPGRDPSRVYFGTDTRVQALLVGAALAAFLVRGTSTRSTRRRSMALVTPVGVVGAVLLAAMLVTVRDTAPWMFRGGYLLVAVATAAVIAAAVQPRHNIVRVALSPSPLRWIGKISYGLYLWHWLIYLVVTPDRVGLRGMGLLLLRLAITFAFAIASFYLVEQPIRSGRWLRRRRSSVVAIPVAAVAFALVFFALPHVNVGSALPVAYAGRNTATQIPKRILVVGDSVALTLGVGLNGLRQESNLKVFNRARLGCGLSERGEIYYNDAWLSVHDLPCSHWLANWKRNAAETDPDVVVALVSIWVVQDLRVGGQELRFGTSRSDRFLLEQLDRGVRALLATTPRVVLLTAPYNKRDTSISPGVGAENAEKRIDHFNALLRRYVSLRSNRRVDLVDLNAFVSPKHRYANSVRGVELRIDGVHFSKAGAQLIARWLLPHLSTRRS